MLIASFWKNILLTRNFSKLFLSLGFIWGQYLQVQEIGYKAYFLHNFNIFNVCWNRVCTSWLEPFEKSPTRQNNNINHPTFIKKIELSWLNSYKLIKLIAFITFKIAFSKVHSHSLTISKLWCNEWINDYSHTLNHWVNTSIRVSIIKWPFQEEDNTVNSMFFFVGINISVCDFRNSYGIGLVKIIHICLFLTLEQELKDIPFDKYCLSRHGQDWFKFQHIDCIPNNCQ